MGTIDGLETVVFDVNQFHMLQVSFIHRDQVIQILGGTSPWSTVALLVGPVMFDCRNVGALSRAIERIVGRERCLRAR